MLTTKLGKSAKKPTVMSISPWIGRQTVVRRLLLTFQITWYFTIVSICLRGQIWSMIYFFIFSNVYAFEWVVRTTYWCSTRFETAAGANFLRERSHDQTSTPVIDSLSELLGPAWIVPLPSATRLNEGASKKILDTSFLSSYSATSTPDSHNPPFILCQPGGWGICRSDWPWSFITNFTWEIVGLKLIPMPMLMPIFFSIF